MEHFNEIVDKYFKDTLEMSPNCDPITTLDIATATAYVTARVNSRWLQCYQDNRYHLKIEKSIAYYALITVVYAPEFEADYIKRMAFNYMNMQGLLSFRP